MTTTTIAISKQTKSKLEKLGRKNESYDAIIERLLSISERELELIDDVYRLIKKTPRERYVRLE